MSSEKGLRLAAEAVKLKAEEDRLQAELAMRPERQRWLELDEEAAASKADAEALLGTRRGSGWHAAGEYEISRLVTLYCSRSAFIIGTRFQARRKNMFGVYTTNNMSYFPSRYVSRLLGRISYGSLHLATWYVLYDVVILT